MNDLEYRRQQLLKLQHAVIDLEDLSSGVSIADLTLNDFRMDLSGFVTDHLARLEHLPFGTFATTTAIPPDARVDRRVPKKLFMEQGAPTAADKRHLQNGIEEVMWLAALKPANIGVASFQDELREYLEIAVLSAILRTQTKTMRIIELMPRAIPYPLVLLAAHVEAVTTSLAHKHASHAEGGKVVLEDKVVSAPPAAQPGDVESAFLNSLPLADQPSLNRLTLYQGWINCVVALAAARLTGSFAPTLSMEAAAARQAALDDHARIQREIIGLRAQAAKERQLSRRVELNFAIKRLEVQRTALSQALTGETL
jgi:hypothetical protein